MGSAHLLCSPTILHLRDVHSPALFSSPLGRSCCFILDSWLDWAGAPPARWIASVVVEPEAIHQTSAAPSRIPACSPACARRWTHPGVHQRRSRPAPLDITGITVEGRISPLTSRSGRGRAAVLMGERLHVSPSASLDSTVFPAAGGISLYTGFGRSAGPLFHGAASMPLTFTPPTVSAGHPFTRLHQMVSSPVLPSARLRWAPRSVRERSEMQMDGDGYDKWGHVHLSRFSTCAARSPLIDGPHLSKTLSECHQMAFSAICNVMTQKRYRFAFFLKSGTNSLP